MTMEEAIQAIEAAKAQVPELTSHGKGVPTDRTSGWVYEGALFDKERNSFSPRNVATAIAYLREYCRPARTRKGGTSSYGLKHDAERWGQRNGLQPYVTNGELIVAAVYLGFKIETMRNCPNAWISCRTLKSKIKGGQNGK
jgi:hypothetical protein